MTRFLHSSIFFLALVLLIGCGSSRLAVYPSQEQKSSVQMTTRSGYTFLSSTKGPSTVTVSLRGARESFVKSYVSITNGGTSSVEVQPENIRVVTLGPRERTLSAYSPGEVPSVVAQSARASGKSVMEMDNLNVSSNTISGGERKRGINAGTGSYGSPPESEGSYMDLMLQGQSISPQNVASGLVYTPFNRNIDNFRLEIPVGDKTHVFRFQAQTVEGG